MRRCVHLAYKLLLCQGVAGLASCFRFTPKASRSTQSPRGTFLSVLSPPGTSMQSPQGLGRSCHLHFNPGLRVWAKGVLFPFPMVCKQKFLILPSVWVMAPPTPSPRHPAPRSSAVFEERASPEPERTGRPCGLSSGQGPQAWLSWWGGVADVSRGRLCLPSPLGISG